MIYAMYLVVGLITTLWINIKVRGELKRMEERYREGYLDLDMTESHYFQYRFDMIESGMMVIFWPIVWWIY